jgi:hypothetical protein
MTDLQTISKLKIKVRRKRKTRIKALEQQIPKNVKWNNYVNDNNHNEDVFGYFTIEKLVVWNHIRGCTQKTSTRPWSLTYPSSP